jgi:iron complex transport system ATP-binding protein
MSITVCNLSYAYGDKKVLNQLNFRIDKGTLTSVLGPNGIGKSTLFKCLLGIFTDYSGDIYLENANRKSLSVKEMAKHIAYIPQAHSSVFNFTVFEMVLMGTTSHFSSIDSPKREQTELAFKALEVVGISGLKERGFMQLSGGEQQLVLIARALAQQAAIFIMDEPTSNLDYGNQIKILSLLKKLAGEGYTILQSTHNPDQAMTFSDSVMALWEGKLLKKGSPGEVITPELIKTLYGIQVQIQSVGESGFQVCIPIIE